MFPTVLTVMAGAVAVAQDWVEVTSPHFTVVSHAGGERARRVALEFEVIRAVFQAALPGATADPNRPLVILVVPDDEALEMLFPQLQGRSGPTPAGVYRSGPLRHHIVLRANLNGRERYQVVYHEYFHLLTSLTSGRLPPWLMEGLAEVYANTTVRGRTAEVGDQRSEYLQFLLTQRMQPLEELVAAEADPHRDSAYETMLFYAQSWALTHFLLLGDTSGSGQSRLFDYIDQVQRGQGAVDAFVDVFGDLDDIERALNRYVRQSGFFGMRLEAPASVGDDAFGVRPLSPDEVLSIQAGVIVQGTRPQAARRLLDEALSLAPRSPEAHEVLGLLHLQRDEREAAALAFADAATFGSHSYIPYYLGAVLRSQAADPDALDDVERLLRRSVELNPRFAPAYAVLAGVVAADPTPARTSEALDLAREGVRLEPSGAQQWVALGDALIANNLIDEARATATEGLSRIHDPEGQEVLRSFLARSHDADPIVNRAHVLRARNELERARATYHVALAVDPNHVGAYNGLGATLVGLGQLEAAADAHQHAIALDPTNADSHAALAGVRLQQGRLEAAEAAYRRAVDQDPSHADAQRNLAVVLSRLGRLDEAQAALERAVQLETAR